MVLANQVRARAGETLERSPANYTEHVEEMIEMFGKFEFTVDELLVDGTKAYACSAGTTWARSRGMPRRADPSKLLVVPYIASRTA